MITDDIQQILHNPIYTIVTSHQVLNHMVYLDHSNFCLLFVQNFLFVSKDEDSSLKAIDFGLSDFVKPGLALCL